MVKRSISVIAIAAFEQIAMSAAGEPEEGSRSPTTSTTSGVPVEHFKPGDKLSISTLFQIKKVNHKIFFFLSQWCCAGPVDPAYFHYSPVRKPTCARTGFSAQVASFVPLLQH
jgi:hypothetical protein